MSKNTEVLVSREYRATGGIKPDRRCISVRAKTYAALRKACKKSHQSMGAVVEALTDERALEAFAARLRAGEVA